MILLSWSSKLITAVAVITGAGSFLSLLNVVEGASSSSSSDNTRSSIIVLEDFTSPPQQQHEWEEMNDPVMGGKSTGTFQIKPGLGGPFVGKVAIVPFLHAPGFIKVESSSTQSSSSSPSSPWPDLSSCEGLQLTVKAHTQYKGYRVSFGKNRPSPDAFQYIYGYKANFDVRRSRNFVDVQIPFDEFTDNWDPATGDAIISCKEDNQYCPDEATKQDLYSIGIWGEGVKGNIHLDVKMISAYGCDATTSSSNADVDDNEEEQQSSFADDDDNDDEIVIEDFSSELNHWITLNDPVMGGRSTSSLTIQDGIASFTGRCAIVPFLDAPGFITMVTGRRGQKQHAIFPDVSTCNALKITLRTMTNYDGYYVSFGTDRVPGGHHAMGYKTPLKNVPYGNFDDIILPFSSFSSKWDDATGKTEVKCSEDPQYCPTIETLKDMKTMSFWGEGVEGDIALDIKSISAVGCDFNIGRDDYESLLLPSSKEAASISTAINHGGGSVFSAGSSNLFILFVALAAFGLLLMVTRTIQFNRKRSMYEELEVDATSGIDLT